MPHQTDGMAFLSPVIKLHLSNHAGVEFNYSIRFTNVWILRIRDYTFKFIPPNLFPKECHDSKAQ